MGVEGEGSVTRWIADLKAGDAEAARPLWDRYFADLVRVARTKLRGPDGPGPMRTRRTPPSAPSAASATAPPTAGSRTWSTATPSGLCSS